MNTEMTFETTSVANPRKLVAKFPPLTIGQQIMWYLGYSVVCKYPTPTIQERMEAFKRGIWYSAYKGMRE